ncbi:MAG: PEP/pyruvate-binding domain-containing protein [Desulfobacteraceae bacterium]
MPLIISFPGTEQTNLAAVGGKGYSLIRMFEAGLPVPSGAVLTTNFFAPWLDEIKSSKTWGALADATQDKWATLCNELKELCSALSLTKAQLHALNDLYKNFSALGDGGLFAVRSSSPEEDLTSASFAGGYETRLGVRSTELEEAVRHCFASIFDERVFVYKKEHGFDVLSPSIAVVVQLQLDSDVGGVGFSLNPITNDYDEAVINANWGLGESVVAGLASPDHFVIDKVDRQPVEKKLGAKKVSIWLGAEGDTIERKDHRSAECTLTDAQLGELTDLVCRIEALYEKPMDIEWAYAGGHLYVLQARPITTYVPLPPETLTQPGERRRLYADAALSKGMTINAPISPMGLDWMEDMYLSLVDSLVGQSLKRDVTPEEAAWFFTGGRMYMNLSNIMWLASLKKMAKSVAPSDALMAELFESIDEERYRTAAKPTWARLRTLRFIPKVLWGLRGFFTNILWAILFPERARRVYQQKISSYEMELAENLDDSLPLDEFRRRCTERMIRELFDITMSALMSALIALASVDLVVRRKPAEEKAMAEKLKLGFTGNVVVEMGIALFRLAKLLDRSDVEDLNRLAERIENRQMSTAFLRAWDAFISTYGCRGPMEMDLASPHYGDDPCLVLRQVSFMVGDDEGFDPEATHRRYVEERRRSYELLMSRSGWLRRKLLRRVYRIIDLFAGTRDTPKHQMLQFQCAVRKRVLTEGRRLVQEGRLNVAEDIFDLTFGDLESAALTPTLDLRAIREKRTHFLKILKTHVTEFPAVIDSRGRILRPSHREEKPGEMSGMPVSPGVVSGPAKVLHDPHSKPVNKGDVLVAYTTDPGWTPLFVNAAAVVLEVGGILQHGAVVAREYGKPCVVGIDRVMTKLQDGQRLEVDGTAGVIRLLS